MFYQNSYPAKNKFVQYNYEYDINKMKKKK